MPISQESLRMNQSSASHSHRYRQAGVDIDAGNQAVDLMKPAIRATFTPNVLADVGSFGGLYALTNLPAGPVLVASTDGVGTKVKLAASLGNWRTIGHDIVNHCVNDILVQNARPLFFLDYVAAAKLAPAQVAEVVIGIAEACQAAGCALLGGETAEMPGVYAEGAFDLVGTVVGLVARDTLLPRQDAMQAGDLLIGLPSSGPHTNGYSLIRQIIAERDLDELIDGVPLGQTLLVPHRCYRQEVDQLAEAGISLLGLAHITGGGFVDNVPRILPDHLTALVRPASWTLPPLFANLMEWGDVAAQEAYRVWNMGIGMVLVVPQSAQTDVTACLSEAVVIGQLAERAAGAPPVQFVP